MTAQNLLYFCFLAFGAEHLNLSKQYSRIKEEKEGAELENKEESNESHLEKTFNLEIVYIFLISLRIVINILAIKWRDICRLTLLLELLIMVTSSNMLIKSSVEREAFILVCITFVNFLMSYMSWKRDIVLSLLSIIPFYVVRGMSDEGGGTGFLVGLLLVSIIWLTLVLLLAHIAVLKIGTIFTENVVLISSRLEFIQNLEERILVLKENLVSVIYSNAGEMIGDDGMAKSFAMIEKSVFEGAIADPDYVME